jgi:DNA-binding HxlR family transcriptional regulator
LEMRNKAGMKPPEAGSEDRPDVFSQYCPARKTLELISGAWAVLTIQAVGGKTLRYGELKRRIEGITHKMLTQTLRKLERDGLMERKIFPVVPPRVEYRLSRLGKTLLEPLGALCRWSERHFDRVEAARTAYGQKNASKG